MGSILTRSVKTHARAQAEWVKWDGIQNFGVALPEGAQAGDILLLASAHLTAGLRRCRDNPKTRNHPNVSAPIEIKHRGREYRQTLKTDVASYIAERSNCVQDMGVGNNTWMSRLENESTLSTLPGPSTKTNPNGNKLPRTCQLAGRGRITC